MKKNILILSTLVAFMIQGASASIPTSEVVRFNTPLSAALIAREALDEVTYPHFMKYVKTLASQGSFEKTDPRNARWIKSPQFFSPKGSLWDGFFQAAAADHLTSLRAFVLLGRELKKNGVVVYGPGTLFEDAVKRNRVDLGLAIPAQHLAPAIWSPDPTNHDPEFLVHIKVFYTQPFIHQFPDEILPADLKVGFNSPDTYWFEGKQYSHPAMDADIYYGPKNGVGFRNVKGIGGSKRGLLGFFQKALFFLPDAVDSMIIREETGEMVTEALVNTSVKDFEKNPIYGIRIKPSQETNEIQRD